MASVFHVDDMPAEDEVDIEEAVMDFLEGGLEAKLETLFQNDPKTTFQKIPVEV